MLFRSQEEKEEAILRRWSADLGHVPARVFNPSLAYRLLDAALRDVGAVGIRELSWYSRGYDTESVTSNFKHAHRLLRMIPSQDCTVFAVCPASVRIGRVILEKQFKEDLDSAKSLMGKMSGAHLGLVFEPYAHWMLSNAHEFRIRNLTTNKFEDFRTVERKVIDVTNAQVLDSSQGLSFSANAYYQPADPTFAVVDSWTDEAMFQVTVSLAHPIKSAAKPFLALRKRNVPGKLIFVVPQNCAAHFRKQELVKADGRGPAPSSGWNDVEQYVLGL